MTKVLDRSFLTFVYPFSFDADDFDKRVAAFETAELPVGKGVCRVWKGDQFPRAELLPHIANFLEQGANPKRTANIWALNERFKDPKEAIGLGKEWRFAFRRRDPDAPKGAAGETFEIPFVFEELQLIMFRTGIGILSVRIRPLTDALESWLDINHYFRFLRRKNGALTARHPAGQDGFEDYFPPPAAGKTEPFGSGNFADLIDLFLGTGGKGKWWSNVFIPNQLLPYSAIFTEGHPAEEDPVLFYKLRNFFHTKQGKNPSRSDLRPDHPLMLEYGDRQWFMFALDGGNFLACDAPETEFFKTTLPAHLRDEYFHVFIMAVHQRFALSDLSHQVAEHWWVDDEEEKIAAFNRIRDRFLSFTARCFFAQAMQREHHHRCYRKWQEVFEVRRIFAEVREEVREMFDWLQLTRAKRLEEAAHEQARLARRFEQRLNRFGLLLAAGFGVPSLLVGFLGINLSGVTSEQGMTLTNTLLLFLAAVIISVAVAMLMIRHLGKDNETNEKRPPSASPDS